MSFASLFLTVSSPDGEIENAQTLAASDRDPRGGEPPSPSFHEGGESSIGALVVDADADIRAAVGEALRAWGYRLSEATSVEEALSIFQKEYPAIVILGLRLPDGSALVASTKIKRRFPDTIVVIIMCEGTLDEAFDIGAAQASGFVTKPIDKTNLWNVLRSAFGQKLRKRAAKKVARQRKPGAPKPGRPHGKIVSPLGRLIMNAMDLLSLSYKGVVIASEQLSVLSANPDMRIGKSTLGNIISGNIRQPGSAKLDSLRIILHLSRAEIDAAIGLDPERRLSEQLEITGERTHEISRDVVTRGRKIKFPILRKDASLEATGFLSGLIERWVEVDVEYLGFRYPPHLVYAVVGQNDTYVSPVAPPGRDCS